ncbi:CBN-TSP-21 protein [Aphelenchoides avenae]|nr:CBN-TSP-21 protein [Aphelenchus avenae]
MSAAGLCVSAGGMAIIVAFIGCMGSWTNSKFVLIAYFFFVCLLLVVQIVTGLMGHFYDSETRVRVKHALYATINRTHAIDHGPEANLRITWDHMQRRLHCCGVESYTDWHYSPQWRHNKFVPDSCCDPGFFTDDELMSNCGKNDEHSDIFFKQGCYKLFTDWLLQHLVVVAVFSVVFAIVETIVLVATGRILWTMRQREKRSKYEVGYRYRRDSNDDGECVPIRDGY